MKTISKEKIIIEKVNLTWENTMPMYLEVLTNPMYSAKAKETTKEELMRLAKLVDEVNGKTIIENENE